MIRRLSDRFWNYLTDRIEARMHLQPDRDNTLDLGSSDYQWRRVYVGPGSVSAPAVTLDGDTNTGIYQSAADNLDIATGGVQRLNISSKGIMIGDDANTSLTQGVTINQGGADDEIVSLKSSDVAHGITDLTETDTYAAFRKVAADYGGLSITGYTEDEIGVHIGAVYINRDTGKNSAANAAVQIAAYEKSGTSVTTPTNDDNLLAVRAAAGTCFIIDEDGDFHYDGAGAAFDSYDDVALCRLLDRELSPDSVIQSEFDVYVQEHRSQLEQAGVVTFNEDGHHFICGSQLQRLHNGAIWQLATRLFAAERQVTKLQTELHLLRGESHARHTG